VPSGKRDNPAKRLRALLKAGKHGHAVAAAMEALRAEPGDARYWAYLGTARAQLGEHAGAKAAFERAVALEARLPFVWHAYGEARALAGELPQAADCYRRALALAPNDGGVRRALAALPADVVAAAAVPAVKAEVRAPRLSRPSRRPRSRWWKLRRAGGIVFVALAAAFLVFCRLDSQAIPKTVDAVRSVVGDGVVLFAEDKVFRVKGWLDERIYAAQVRSGAAEAHPAEVDTVLQAPPAVVAPSQPADLATDTNDANAGHWRDCGPYLLTHVYPEPNHRSVADVAYLKSGAALHVACGTAEPAVGSGSIATEHRDTAFMAFSGGFQYKHFPSGIQCEGQLLRKMRSGIGTLMVLDDNQVRIGKWGREWTEVLPQMKDIRQFLLLVDGGKFNENVNFNAYALGSAVRVYRSALGLTADGHLVYAAGDSLSAAGLARTLIACGAVSAVHLDMNYGNATCGVISRAGGQLKITPLTERFPEPSRFLGRNYRDFLYLTRATEDCRAD
jgi:hypothetical protein